MTTKNAKDCLFVALVTNGRITLARQLFRLPSGNFEIRPRDRRVPSFFVDFPLIGSEVLELPFILQSHPVDPDEKRSAIYLSNHSSADNNKKLLAKTAELFDIMISGLAKLEGAHYLAYFPLPSDLNVDQLWLKSNIHMPIRKTLLDQPIFLNFLGNKINLLEAWIFVHGPPNRGFELCRILSPLFGAKLPYYDFNYYQFLTLVFDPEFEQVSGKVIRNLSFVYSNLQSFGSTRTLAFSFAQSHGLAIHFLNQLFAFDQNKEYKKDPNLKIFPNQKGEFCQLSALKKDLDIPDPLKQVRNRLGCDFESILLSKFVTIEIPLSRSVSDVAAEINWKISSLHSNKA